MEKDINNVISYIKKGQPICLYGNRRIGKTTLALEIKNELEKQGYKVAYIDCATITNENDLWKMILKRFSLNYNGQFKKLDYDFTDAMENDQYNKVLILDEFELLINKEEISVNVFNYMRGLINPYIKLNYLFISEKPISDLMMSNINFIGSPLWNIFNYYELKK